jgi:hypothetical protein
VFPALKEGLSAAEFDELFIDIATKAYAGMWTQYATTKRGEVPVGFIAGVRLDGHWLLTEFIAFPWASVRNRAETLVKFLNWFRTVENAVVRVKMSDKKMFEFACRTGVLRRTGTWFNWYGTEPAAIFQTNSLQEIV